jgi:hypothetical protein
MIEENGASEVEQTFLQRLYHHSQSHTIPVVDEAFVQAFSALSEEDQFKAMNHLFYMSAIDKYPADQQTRVYVGRIAALHKAWYQDLTDTWVGYVYNPPIDAHYWAQELQERVAREAKSITEILEAEVGI